MHYRAIFISDIHLGSRTSHAELLCDFFKHNTSDKLYLVGDIIDGWRLRKKWYFPQSHVNVIRRILTASKRGTEVMYIMGNHDEAFRKFLSFELTLGNIKFCNEMIHISRDGSRILVTHGDDFDKIMLNSKWLMHIGDSLYTAVVWINIHLNFVRNILGLKYWSLSKFLKTKTKQAVSFITSYETYISDHCRINDYDGVVCGHIHAPVIKKINDIRYYNSGDWTENCTAIVETIDGEYKLIYWEKHGENTISN